MGCDAMGACGDGCLRNTVSVHCSLFTSVTYENCNYPRRLCQLAWIGFSSPSVCPFVRSITQKRMIQKCSNLV